MTDREIMQQSLEALELHAKQYPHMQKGYTVDAITALSERLAQPEQELVMKRIKTWSERCEEHPDHQQGMISEGMIRARMQEEIDELRQALETEQEPVALETVYDTIIHWDETDGKRSRRELARRIVALYTTPPRREWQGLTEEEADALRLATGYAAGLDRFTAIARAIEAKLKEKNA